MCNTSASYFRDQRLELRAAFGEGGEVPIPATTKGLGVLLLSPKDD
jgi:hypothetical protein